MRVARKAGGANELVFRDGIRGGLISLTVDDKGPAIEEGKSSLETTRCREKLCEISMQS